MIKYYQDYLSADFYHYLKKDLTPVKGVVDLYEYGASSGLETTEALAFLKELYLDVHDELDQVLKKRIADRKFIDERVKATYKINQDLKRQINDADYITVLNLEDGDGRVVVGPLHVHYAQADLDRKKVAPLPDYLKGPHITLFGPPDSAKLSINAMNAYHRKLPGEPAIIGELLDSTSVIPKWGADDEDSKTPMRADLVEAEVNLKKCFDKTLNLVEGEKRYELQEEKLSLPIKRFPGLALPSFFLFYQDQPIPLHLYDFAIHLFHHWNQPEALVFYVPKLENEEEARYLKNMLEKAERKIQKNHPEYKLGTIRLMIVLENPRMIFRTHEMMDELYPYFAGASLGWHDYLGSTARLFKEDGNYRIPVKADPDIVIKYIKASHQVLSEVVGTRGGIKIGGMYGILPISADLQSDSFQVTLKGYIRDVVTQMKRGLNGFWVAHPDFVRLGIALVKAWEIYESGDKSKLHQMVRSLLKEKFAQEVLSFIEGKDIEGLNQSDVRYARSLIVADLKESDYISNNHPDEIRYNVFQSLQYLTDWLCGNGCVALPAQVGGVAVRVMDDLATAERSRWEVWHELYHGRFSLDQFLKIVFEEMHFIRKELSDSKKIVQVKYNERTEKWYPVALKLMIKLMTDKNPAEFATELLLPFTIDSIRNATDPWKKICEIDKEKYSLDPQVERFIHYFEMCGSLRFASTLSDCLVYDEALAEKIIKSFSKEEIIEAASFHGNIGESKKTLDAMASSEQALVFKESEKIREELKNLGETYLKKFGVKFLISAKGKSGEEMLSILKNRLNNTETQELDHARTALWEITQKRMKEYPLDHLKAELLSILQKHKLKSAQISLSTDNENIRSFGLGETNENTWFEFASLSKTVGTALSLDYFKKMKIPLTSKVNDLLSQTKSSFRLTCEEGKNPAWASDVTLSDLMSHTALNMHYVFGVPSYQEMPKVEEFLNGHPSLGYVPVKVINAPGKVFKYSGAGFIVLEYLLEQLSGKSIHELAEEFFKELQVYDWSFKQWDLENKTYATGFTIDGKEVPGKRLMFPSFAAGMMGTSEAMERFLSKLAQAYNQPHGVPGLSHDTAVMMLTGQDLGSLKFMGTLIGLGVFIGEAGDNKFMIHQGANDGFRAIYLHCFAGPDTGKGMTLLCNGELNGVLALSEMTQTLLKAFSMRGIDYSRFKKNFSLTHLSQEEIVNIGYKSLVFDAFIKTRPEPILNKGPIDPLSSYNLAVGGEVLEVSNERFACAENLLSPNLPKFEPDLFGKQGKVMDSWESVRHNPFDHDFMIFKIPKPEPIYYVSLSTQYHFGNQAPEVSVEGRVDGNSPWEMIVPRTKINGHSQKHILAQNTDKIFSEIKACQYPDGGFTRLGLYGKNLPDQEKKKFLPEIKAESVTIEEKIPQTKKPLTIKYLATESEVKKNVGKISEGELFNNASVAFGAKLISATDEHYAPAVQMLSPFEPLNMFDGLESARSRVPGHFEEVEIELAFNLPIEKVEMDFTYFVNNNPKEIELFGEMNGSWVVLIDRDLVKPFAGNKKIYDLKTQNSFKKLRLRTYPDGGMNRLRVYSRMRKSL